jgi:hypothetical protein
VKKTKSTKKPKPSRAKKPAAKPAAPKPTPLGAYKAEYCDLAINLGRLGRSRTQIAVEIGVTRKTLSRWIEDHAEFAEACELADDCALAYFETIGAEGALSGPRFNDRAWWHLVRNRFPDHYRDAKEVELSGAIGGEPVKLVVSAAEIGV